MSHTCGLHAICKDSFWGPCPFANAERSHLCLGSPFHLRMIWVHVSDTPAPLVYTVSSSSHCFLGEFIHVIKRIFHIEFHDHMQVCPNTNMYRYIETVVCIDNRSPCGWRSWGHLANCGTGKQVDFQMTPGLAR